MFTKNEAAVVVVTVVPEGETLKPSLPFTSTEKLLLLGNLIFVFVLSIWEILSLSRMPFVNVPVVPDTAPREVSDPAVKLVTIPVVALKVAAVVIPAISTPVGDSVTVPTPDRLLILSTLISDAIWVHFPPLVLVIYQVAMPALFNLVSSAMFLSDNSLIAFTRIGTNLSYFIP